MSLPISKGLPWKLASEALNEREVYNIRMRRGQGFYYYRTHITEVTLFGCYAFYEGVLLGGTAVSSSGSSQKTDKKCKEVPKSATLLWPGNIHGAASKLSKQFYLKHTKPSYTHWYQHHGHPAVVMKSCSVCDSPSLYNSKEQELHQQFTLG